MIVLQQSIPSQLERLRELLSRTENIVIFTTNHQDVLDHIAAQREHPSRTIVITSGFIYSLPGLTGDVLARRIKQLDPSAWCFICSVSPQKGEAVDGTILKGGSGDVEKVIELCSLDFNKVDTLKKLRLRLPWIK